jgi:addiction module RelB/DinJ family antitoxin
MYVQSIYCVYMNTAVINIRTDSKLKVAAAKLARELGLDLSGVMNGFLREFVRSKTVNFSTVSEEPSEYLIRAIREAKEERKKGNYYSFSNSDDALAFLDKVTHDN